MEVLVMVSVGGPDLLFLTLMASLITTTFTQEEQQLYYRVEEEVSEGYVIGDLVTDSGLSDKYTRDILDQLQFQFLVENDVNISVGSNSGELFTSGRIDREQICPRRTECHVLLDIAVQPVSYFQIIKVMIEIADINDHVPTFGKPSVFTLSIKESSSLESTFLIPTATDEDSPMYSVRKYELLPASPKSKFDIKVNNKLDGSTDVRLVLKSRLDREEEAEFVLGVVAFDGGLDPQMGELEVRVIVQDSNDNDPVFDNSTYEVTIVENTPVRSMILRVHATDRDIGENGEVIYDFSETTNLLYGATFGIDQESGEIYIKGEIDHETVPIYHLTVMAEDLGPDSLPADTTVIINIEDINDNAPLITVSTLSSPDTNRAAVTEDSPEDTFVAHVRVKDPDGGKNGRFNCTLNDDNFRLIRRYERDYQVLTSAVLDREQTPHFNLALVCKDGGDEPKIAIKHLQVYVDDVNDNAPMFSHRTYTAILIENSYVGAIVKQVNATDEDSGVNALLNFSLSGGGADNFFHINSHGRITALRSIDREKHSQFQFHVIASDKGTPALTGSALVVVTIEDVNDEAPTFVEELYLFKVTENQTSGVLVGALNATDPDGPPYNSFRYSIASSSGRPGAFAVDPVTGVIKTARSIDREQQSVYYLVAQVTDQNAPILTGTVSITVYIIDINDNAPRFEFPTATNNTVHISNQVPLSFIVTKVTAHDLDSDRNSRLTYSLQGNTNYETFGIDPNLGTISVEMSLEDVTYRVYDLTISVHDHGTPSLSARAHLSLVVNKSIPFPLTNSSNPLLAGHNFVIVVSLSCICAVIAAILVIAIVLIRRQDRGRQQNKYNCRMEALSHKPPSDGVYSTESTPTKIAPSLNGKMNGGGSFLSINDLQKEDDTTRYEVPRKLVPASKSVCSQYLDSCENAGPWLPQSNREIQIVSRHADLDDVSMNSCDGSNTDSGRGASEEGDRLHARGQGPGNRLPLHPPPPPTRIIPAAHGYQTMPHKTTCGVSPGGDTMCRHASLSTSKDNSSMSSIPIYDSESDFVHARPARVMPTSARHHYGQFYKDSHGFNHAKRDSSLDVTNAAGALEMTTRQMYTTDTLGDMKSVVV